MKDHSQNHSDAVHADRGVEHQLREKDEDFHLIFETMPIGWADHQMVFDADNNPIDYIFLRVNGAFERFTGLTRGAILGKRVTDVIPGIRDANPNLIALYGDVVLNGIERRLDLYFEPFDRWYRVTAFRRLEGRFIAMFEDISRQKRAEGALRLHAKALRRSNRELEQFAYVASHDLQEPLRMVASYTQLLAERYEGRLDEKADKYISHAVDGAKRMQGLISDLLEFSRVETAGRPKDPTDCRGVLEEVTHSLQASINESGASIHVGEMPTIAADRTQIGQVFQNLIGNAVKFRGVDSPRVEVTARRTDENWVFSVSDNGIGIEPRFQERIFNIFTRLHERGAFPGSGIGLAIVKKIVERHDGHIRVESEIGQGARFVFTIPVKVPPAGTSD
jgi:signal transduction histidine kinase